MWAGRLRTSRARRVSGSPRLASFLVPLQDFHPAVAALVQRAPFAAPTDAQVAAWPAIRAGRHTLVAAPTGSGKTLTAFLAALDGLVRDGLAPGGLADETTVVYVSPLKALSNDIRANLEAPLAGIRAELARARPARRRDPHRRAHRRHAAARAPPEPEAAAAHPGDDARVALRAARLGLGPGDARDRAHA